MHTEFYVGAIDRLLTAFSHQYRERITSDLVSASHYASHNLDKGFSLYPIFLNSAECAGLHIIKFCGLQTLPWISLF